MPGLRRTSGRCAVPSRVGATECQIVDLHRLLPRIRSDAQVRAQEHGRSQKFFGELDAWLNAHAREGSLKKLPFEICFALWLGPAEVFTRYWVLGPRDEKQIKAAEVTLAAAAWDALRRL